MAGGQAPHRDDTPSSRTRRRPRSACRPSGDLSGMAEQPTWLRHTTYRACESEKLDGHVPNQPKLFGNSSRSSVRRHQKGGHHATVKDETNVPGVPADGCHHESRPAKLVPRVHVRAFQHQPGQKRGRRSQGKRCHRSIPSSLELTTESVMSRSGAAQETQHGKLIQSGFSSAARLKRTNWEEWWTH